MQLLTLAATTLFLQAAIAAPTAPKFVSSLRDGFTNTPSSPPSLTQNASISDSFIGPRSALWDFPHPASDELWEKAVCKGAGLIQAIKKPDREAADYFQPPPPGMTVQSEFQNFPQAFADWQWYQSDGADINPGNGNFEEDGWGIADAMRGLKVSDRSVNQGGENFVAWMQHGPVWVEKDGKWEHHDVKGQPYKYKGKEYKYTEAYYQWAMNPEQGLITALNLESPEHAVDWPKDELPALRRASDVMYGTWNLVNEGKDLAGLNYYIVAGIQNEDSKAIIVRAFGSADVTEWPGKTIGLLNNEGKYNKEALAMLGAPVSQPLSYMLIQHKEAFAKLRPVIVQMFLCNSRLRLACLVWHVKGNQPDPPDV